ncbi:cupin domain-containing protein [Pontibacter oryzae]|uniref:Cupin domain-containing protein n=1 Tax=Pontibacter oryzae TaxID=2304593 RepID=A0A399RW71_9BACT|nr:cupin domain-containing protein [Pontibacter oryzae]RIJ34299.1 cupin domain-containing protein [Pontibacter oryzae]
MNPIQDIIESGVLELYALGAASPGEVAQVERLAAEHPEVHQEINAISQAIERYAQAHAVQPCNTVKPLMLATIDYMERMKRGELPLSPPILTEKSRSQDFEKWLTRQDMRLPSDADAIFAKIIGYTPAATTAIVWIHGATDFEVHHDELERFLILEGACTITIAGEKHPLKPGDFFAIPLHVPHSVQVTSEEPCKAILQRLSAAQ